MPGWLASSGAVVGKLRTGTHQQENAGLILQAMPGAVTSTGQEAGLKLPGRVSNGGGLSNLLMYMEAGKVSHCCWPQPAQAQAQRSPGCPAAQGRGRVAPGCFVR